jgi:putative CocE/NonD family hydrolase
MYIVLKRIIKTTAILWIVFSQLATTALADSDGPYEIRIEKSVMIPMRDGAVLSTDLYFPKGASGKLPVLLNQTMYNKNGWFNPEGLFAALIKKGFVVAIQDVRGHYESTGRFKYASGRREDGHDTIEWLIRQDWSDQQVGALGCSYQGETVLSIAAINHPNLTVIQPSNPTSGYYTPGRGLIAFDGGVFELAQTAGWFGFAGSQIFYGPPEWVDRREWFLSPAAKLFRQAPEIDFQKSILPLFNTLPTISILERAGIPPTDYEDHLRDAPDSEFSRTRNWLKTTEETNVPALIIDSWYDYGPAEATKIFNQFREKSQSKKARDNQFLIIGPGGHCQHHSASEKTMVGARDLGDARFPYVDAQVKWFSYWMKGEKNGITDMPAVQYYLMGRNTWEQAEEWPITGTKYQKWFLHSAGNANSRHGDGQLSAETPANEPSDHFEYDPANPVPTLGGHTCCTGLAEESGGYDQSKIELRDDILVFTSDALKEGIEVTGPIRVVLSVESSALDTDFTAKLLDVYPDGRAFNIQEGALRMRYREGLDHEVLMEPGKTYSVELDLHATSNWFGPGHRIRLDISSSNFPRWERNLNTGENNHTGTEWVKAQNTVHHSAEHPSYLLLPVVPQRTQ